jgi:hypothetical protein
MSTKEDQNNLAALVANIYATNSVAPNPASTKPNFSNPFQQSSGGDDSLTSIAALLARLKLQQGQGNNTGGVATQASNQFTGFGGFGLSGGGISPISNPTNDYIGSGETTSIPIFGSSGPMKVN